MVLTIRNSKTHLIEAKLVRRFRRAQDESAKMADIRIMAGHGESFLVIRAKNQEK